MYRYSWLAFVFSFSSSVLAQDIYENLEIEDHIGFSSNKDRSEIFEERSIRIYGPGIYRSFRIYKKHVDLVNGSYPHHLRNTQYWASEFVPEQVIEFARIKNEYLDSLKKLIVASLRERNGVLAAYDHDKLIKQLKELYDKKEVEKEGVLLPHQKAIYRQIEVSSRYKSDTVAALTSSYFKKYLKLTEKQIAAVRRIKRDLKAGTMQQNSLAEDKNKELLDERTDRVLEILDRFQKSELKGLIGAKELSTTVGGNH